MAAFTPAITSSNCLEVVRLNRSISIVFVISNLFASSRALPELHNSISPDFFRLSRLRFSTRRTTRYWLKAKALQSSEPLERPEVTAIADVEIRLSVRWRALPRLRCSVFRYGGRKHDTAPDSCTPWHSAS